MASLPNVSPFVVIFSIMLLISGSEAREFLVGGSVDSWKVPLPSPDSLNHWAENQRFRIGDALVWKYDNRTESVLVVTGKAYGSCNVSGSNAKFNDGNTTVLLDRSGPFYFISGAEDHCQKGLKLVVVVMSSRHGATSHISAPAQSPSPVQPPNNQGVSCSSSGIVMMGLGISLVMMFSI